MSRILIDENIVFLEPPATSSLKKKRMIWPDARLTYCDEHFNKYTEYIGSSEMKKIYIEEYILKCKLEK